MKNILLIEDDQWLADSYQAMLLSEGFEVMQFATASEAMEAINEQLPDVIVADIMLGDHNTFLLFHELQSHDDTAKIPVIVCTSLASKQLSRADLKSYGIVEVLDKATLTPDKLALAVREHISREGKATR